ncbi:hypothetical protein ABEF93_000472 [Exophiala dermatitidis]
MDDSTPPEPREERVPRIPPGKLTTINAEPTISVFHKFTKTAVLHLIDGKFPRDAAMVFCDRIRHQLMDNPGAKSFTMTGGDSTTLTEVIAWIKQCIAEQAIVKWKDIDNETPRLFTIYANVIICATYLGIPARDLAEGLTKRMQAIARKVLMSWDEVEWFYKSPALNACGDSVREVAAASIFWAWWNHKLNDEDTPDDMKFLDVLRKEIPKLDKDLHDWCARHEQEVRQKWEDKKNGKVAETGGDDGFTSGGVGGGWNETPSTARIGGGWDEVPSAATAGGDWDQAPAAAADVGGGWDIPPPPGPTAAMGADWETAPANVAAAPAVGGGGWDNPASTSGFAATAGAKVTTGDTFAPQFGSNAHVADYATASSSHPTQRGSSSGFDSAIAVESASTSPVSFENKPADGYRRGNEAPNNTPSFSGLDEDLGRVTDDWADEMNEQSAASGYAW